MKARVILGAVALCAVVGFMLLAPRDRDEAAATPDEPPAVATRPVSSHDKIAPIAPPVVPVATDNTEYPVDPTPATVESPLVDADRAPRLARGIELLDAAITRTEARLAEAEANGDQAAANAARIRVARLRDVRVKRVEAMQ